MRVLTLNCWGLPWTSDYKDRIEAIRVGLLKSQYDIVVLQEIFMSNDIDNYKESLSMTFPFMHYFYSGFIGSGVMFLSRYRIRDPITLPYAQSGTIYHTGGDWFARKSVCYAKIEHPDKLIHIFGTHSQAKYRGDDFEAVRTLQLYFLGRMIQLMTKPTDAVIVAGDLNCESHEIGLKQLMERCRMVDPFYKFYDDDSRIYTCNDRANKYSRRSDQPYRIDYILHSRYFKSISYKIVFKKVPAKEMSYSDHYGVEVVINPQADVAELDTNRELMDNNLHSVKKIMIEGLKDSSYLRSQNLMYGILVLLGYRLLKRAWENYVPKSEIFSSINPIFYTAFVLIWIFSNLVTYISLRCQQRVFTETIEEIDNDLLGSEEQ